MENAPTPDYIRQLLENVPDPEVPALTIMDLGIVRDVQVTDNQVEVFITPTYSGCPAMDFIEVNIRAVLQKAGLDQVKIQTVLSPAWTTDWLSEAGRQKLRAFGIAPPAEASIDKKALVGERRVLACPLCASTNTELLAPFGSTACKALFRCLDCLEPFDYFKCH